MKGFLFVTICLALPSAVWPQEKADQPVFVLNAGGHTAYVTGLLFTPDGKELLSVSLDKTIRIWDTVTGTELRVLRTPLVDNSQVGELYAAALSPDGRTLAVAGHCGSGGDNPIYLIALATGSIQRTLRGHEDAIFALAFSPDGKRLASGSADESARLWNVATGFCEHTLDEHEDTVVDVAFSPDGQRLATASEETGRIWLVKTGKRIAHLDGHQVGVSCVAWSPDGKTIATGGEDRSIRLWDTRGKERKVFAELGNAITSVTFTPDSQRLLFTRGAGGPKVCSLLDLGTGKERVRFPRHTNEVQRGALSCDGTLAATTGGDNDEIYLWRTTDASTVCLPLQSRGRAVWGAAWSKDGQAIAWGNVNKGSTFTPDTPLERSFHLSDLEVGGAPDGTFRRAMTKLGAVSLENADGSVRVRRARGKPAEVELTDSDGAWCFAVLSEHRVAVGGDRLQLFDTRTGKPVHTFLGHRSPVAAVVPSPDNRYLLSASKDQTLRIWTLDGEEPLLSLFFAGDEWVAWTPEGYYAASPGGGEDLMGWHLNQGRDRMARFYSASQFHKSLYRPDVIKLLLKTGSVRLALEAADKARGKATERESVAKVLPPFVEITSPDKPTIETTEPTVEVRFFARGEGNSQPLTAARLLVNGRPYPGSEGVKTFDPPRGGTVRGAWTVRLAPGANTFTVQAQTAASEGVSESVGVTLLTTRGLRKLDPTPEERQALLPTLYILAVGISDYDDKALKLNYADRDATAIAAAFDRYSKGLYKAIEIKRLTNKQATRLNILDGLDWMRKALTPTDIGVFFFAGHGDKDSQGRFYLLPVDVKQDRLLATGVPGTELTNALAVRSRVIVILDACHSGAVDDGRPRSALTDDLVRDFRRQDYGIIMMCSSRGRETSLESALEQQGYFTQATLEGLSGKAKNLKGEVGVNELYAYVPGRVRDLSKQRQSPVFGIPLSVHTFALTKP